MDVTGTEEGWSPKLGVARRGDKGLRFARLTSMLLVKARRG